MRKIFLIAALIGRLILPSSVIAHPIRVNDIPNQREIKVLEHQLVLLINAERAKHGLKKLRPWQILSEQARHHSINMAMGDVPFGHDGFDDRAKAIKEQAKHVGAVGENVAYNQGKQDRLKWAVSMWMDSPSHRSNILGDYDETGIGIAYDKEGRCYLSQLFSKIKIPFKDKISTKLPAQKNVSH